MATPSRELEAVLRREGNPAVAAERANYHRWADYLRERLTPPWRLNFVAFRAWKEAYRRAVEIGCRPRERQILVVPIWFCQNEDEELPSTNWIRSIVAGDELYDDRSCDAVYLLTVEEIIRGFVVESQYYSPEIQLPFRRHGYATVENTVIERIIRVDETHHGAAVAIPSRSVAPFCTDTELAIVTDDGRARDAAAKLRFFP